MLRKKLIINLKIILIIIAVGIFIAVFIIPLNKDDGRKIAPEKSAKSQLENIKSSMTKPFFRGVDENSQPFNITADKAEQIDNENIALTKITGDITLKNGSWVYLSADKANIKALMQTAELIGNVQVNSDKGYQITTAKAHIDLKKSLINGDAPVQIQGLLGELYANSFEFDINSSKFVFENSVRMVIYR